MADVPAIRRAVRILRHISGTNRPLGAGMLAQVLGIPRSSMYDVLAVLRGWETVYLVKEQSLQSAAVITATGVRMPAYLTATGRAIMASLDPQEIRALLAEESGLVSRTGRGPRDLRELGESLRQVRVRGYSLEVGEITPDIWTVAAPVRDAIDRPIAAIGLCLRSPAETVEDDEVERLATSVRTVAGELTRRLRS